MESQGLVKGSPPAKRITDSESTGVSLWVEGWEVEHTPLLPSCGPEVTSWDTGCWLLKDAALGPYSCDTVTQASSYCAQLIQPLLSDALLCPPPMLWSVPNPSIRSSHKNKTKPGWLMKLTCFTFITQVPLDWLTK